MIFFWEKKILHPVDSKASNRAGPSFNEKMATPQNELS